MKLALVTETYPPEVNGVAMTLSRLTSGLVARGHRVEVVRPRQKVELGATGRGPSSNGVASLAPGATPATEPKRAAAVKSNGGPAVPKETTTSGERVAVEEFLVPGLPIPFYNSLRMGLPAWSTLSRRWRSSPPDIVHVATEGPLGLAALRAAKGMRLPVTSSFHTNFHSYGGHYGLRVLRGTALRYLRWFHNRTVSTMVPTDQGAAQLAGDGFQRLTVLARGVDAVLFSPAKRSSALRESWGAAPEDPVVAYVGRLAAEKNLRLAVDAFAAMQALAPSAKFVLVGDGPERMPLARAYPHFIWAGVQRGEQLARHYASADVFIFPSITETFGNVVTEALASGLVVVAYDYASTRQHVREGINGYTASFADPAAFTRAACDVMRHPAQWQSVRAAARATAMTITWDSIVDRFAGELEKARAVTNPG